MNKHIVAKYKMSIPRTLQKVSCGLFGISEDFIEKYQSLDSRFIQNKESTFFFEAVGDSMEPTIFPNEILVVDRSLKKHHGKVCVVTYDDQFLCKRVFVANDHVTLKSDNKKYRDIKVFEEQSALVWGVVIARCGEVC